jgi:hypothetical protein
LHSGQISLIRPIRLIRFGSCSCGIRPIQRLLVLALIGACDIFHKREMTRQILYRN